jgi:hypothetical protein
MHGQSQLAHDSVSSEQTFAAQEGAQDGAGRNIRSMTNRTDLRRFLQAPYDSSIQEYVVPRQQEQLHQEIVANTLSRLRQLHHQQEIDRLQREIQMVQQQNQQMSIDAALTAFRLPPSDVNVPTSFDSTRDIGRMYRNLLDPVHMSTSYQQYQLSTFQLPVQLLEHPLFSSHAFPTNQVSARNFNNLVDMRSPLSIAPFSLPQLLVRPIEDQCRLSEFQYLLRHQIEVFEATDDDVATHVRGRNKLVTFGQVGIRCKYCAHLPVSRRQKGSTYFPSNMLGIYQAAQNMSNAHIQCGLCECMPNGVRLQFIYMMENRLGATNHGAGRSYWSKSASLLGLVDTENHGIRFKWNLPSNAIVVDMQHL